MSLPIGAMRACGSQSSPSGSRAHVRSSQHPWGVPHYTHGHWLRLGLGGEAVCPRCSPRGGGVDPCGRGENIFKKFKKKNKKWQTVVCCQKGGCAVSRQRALALPGSRYPGSRLRNVKKQIWVMNSPLLAASTLTQGFQSHVCGWYPLMNPCSVYPFAF